MSFDFNNINSINKAQSAYKDGGGMGGGGMYMRQRKKRNDDENDIFERSEDKDPNDIELGSDIKDEDIPSDNMFNRFVNWFRIKR